MQMNNWLFELQIYHSAEKKKQGSSLVLPEEVLICTSKDKHVGTILQSLQNNGQICFQTGSFQEPQIVEICEITKKIYTR